MIISVNSINQIVIVETHRVSCFRIMAIPVEIRHGHLPITSQKSCTSIHLAQ
jgi:hypothetical protein